MKLYCPQCAAANKQMPVDEVCRTIDGEGYVVAKVLCPTCGFSNDVRVIQESPPCQRCGHVQRTYLKGDPRGNLIGQTNNPLDVLNALRSAQGPL